MGQGDEEAQPRLAVLIAGGPLANMLVNRLSAHFGTISVLKEDPQCKFGIVRRRARLVGWRQALGQAAFGALKTMLQRRSAASDGGHQASTRPRSTPTQAGWQRIGSVNAPACRRALRQLDPQVVIVYGTRLIQWRTLGCIAAPFITYHAGINGEYRGETGAYWARHQPQRAPAGLTAALIEEGVDGVPYQATVGALPDDNIATDQYRQMASALPLLIRAIEDALKGQLRPPQIELPAAVSAHALGRSQSRGARAGPVHGSFAAGEAQASALPRTISLHRNGVLVCRALRPAASNMASRSSLI
jgi:hypothetical protein